MSRLCPLLGQRFGRLAVLARAVNDRRGRAQWRCRCDCGGETVVPGVRLRVGGVQSCGCLQRARTSAARRTHGEARPASPEYRAWRAMKERCGSPSHVGWPYYGGRGIRVSAAWLSDFPAFLGAVGRRPSPQHSLDRWPDPNGHYEPGNVRWATKREQRLNQRPRIRTQHHEEPTYVD